MWKNLTRHKDLGADVNVSAMADQIPTIVGIALQNIQDLQEADKLLLLL